MPEFRRSLLRHLVLPAAAALSRTRFLEHYREMMSLDRAPRAKTLEVQNRRLVKLLDRLHEVPAWKSLLAGGDTNGASSPSERLAGLPVMEKAQLRGALQEMVHADGNRNGWQFSNSSGTTERVTVVHDFARRDILRASQMRAYRMATGLDVGSSSVEIPPDSCNILCGFEDPGPAEFLPYFGYALRRGEILKPKTIANLRGRFERRVMYRQDTLLPIDAGTPDALVADLDERLDATARCAPMVLRGLPHFLLWMAERATQRGLRLPSLQVLLPYGGLMSPVMAQRCEEALGAPFRDIYGTSELGVVAVACDHGRMHVFEDLYCLEVVDAVGRPATQGAIGDLIVTDLSNRVMPLVRYRVGDLATLSTESCACGREGQTLVIHGRSCEFVELDGVEPLAGRELSDLVFADRRVWNFRLDQRSRDGFELTLVAVPGQQPDGDSIASTLAARLHLSKPPRVRVRPYVRPEGSGKYRASTPRDRPPVSERTSP